MANGFRWIRWRGANRRLGGLASAGLTGRWLRIGEARKRCAPAADFYSLRDSRGAPVWMSVGTRGVESVVEVTFEARGEGTLVTRQHSRIPDDEMGRKHQDGWAWVLSQIAKRF